MVDIAVPPTSLLDLFLRQQTHGEAGVRLSFNEELAKPLTVLRNPYHLAAIKGNIALAAFLHERGVSYEDYGEPVQVAAFTGAGVKGTTPWIQPLSVTPADAALLAGNADIAQMLRLIEDGIPLEWSRQQHHLFPRCFHEAVRPVVEALVSSQWFAALPGPARMITLDTVLCSMARESVYDLLPEPFSDWASVPSSPGPGAPEDEREVFAIAAKLPCRRRVSVAGSDEGSDHGDDQEQVALGVRYHFRMAHGTQHNRQRRGLFLLLRSGAALAALHTARQLGIPAVSLPASAVACAAFFAPLQALVALAGVQFSRRR